MWVLPSYNRPNKLLEVAEIAGDVPMTIRLHDDDPQLALYQAVSWPEAWDILIGPTMRLAPTLNWIFENYPDEAYYGLMADDVRPSPKGWDIVLSESAQEGLIAYPDDGAHGEHLCPHHCISGDLIRAAGWWSLPGLYHSFLDTVWFAIGRELNLLRYHPEILLDHLHPIWKKSSMDGTYERGAVKYADDEFIFKQWQMGGGMTDTLARIRDGKNR